MTLNTAIRVARAAAEGERKVTVQLDLTVELGERVKWVGHGKLLVIMGMAHAIGADDSATTIEFEEVPCEPS